MSKVLDAPAPGEAYVLITGGAGFIGANLADRLARRVAMCCCSIARTRARGGQHRVASQSAWLLHRRGDRRCARFR